ncbi:hypothetical protein ACJD0Z_09515 [Flavobacteriaceae bacterium M23B6Z8]
MSKTYHLIRPPARFILILPVVGMILFVLFYLIAAFNYSGGSYRVPDAAYFDFWYNYLCDLLDATTYQGLPNDASVYARAALVILSVSLSIIWYYSPLLFELKIYQRRIVQISGILSMLIVLFLGSDQHDLIIRIAGFFGIIAFLIMIKALFNAKYYLLALGGVLCILIFFINYLIYESGFLINALPVIQKFTFIFFILWFLLLDLTLYVFLKKR